MKYILLSLILIGQNSFACPDFESNSFHFADKVIIQKGFYSHNKGMIVDQHSLYRDGCYYEGYKVRLIKYSDIVVHIIASELVKVK